MIQLVWVSNNAAMHLGVYFSEVVDLPRDLTQFLQRSSAGSSKSIVLQKLICVEEADFLYWGFRDQIDNVTTSPASADY
ncbi:hypothetical protein RN02_12520 [Pseudomonas sp. PI1]|nr:hypothetical protein RN02_12520 [Pseudomonas sp. PI1]